MSYNRKYQGSIVIPSLTLFIFHIAYTHAGASSTPKNLVNLYSNSLNDSQPSGGSINNQNEFQPYKQNAPKSSSSSSTSDRHGPTPSSYWESLFDQLSSEASSVTSSDYPTYSVTKNNHKCAGRVRVNSSGSHLYDGPGRYETNLQCSWLVDSGQEGAIIRLRFHQFKTECNYDHLYIFDGDSVYSPLVATLSGDIRDFSTELNSGIDRPVATISKDDNQTGFVVEQDGPIYSTPRPPSSEFSATTQAGQPLIESPQFELTTKSGKAFIYFHSDTAQRMSGFYLTFKVGSCPLDCSDRGECDPKTFICSCIKGYRGDGCQYQTCPNNCTSPSNGICDEQRSCICHSGFSGPDCSINSNHQNWISMQNGTSSIPPRAFHKAVVVDNIMWIIGGKSKALINPNMGQRKHVKSNMVYSYNLETRTWSDSILGGITGEDHLAELTGHSVAAKGHKVFIFGGLAYNNSVMNVLTVLDTKTRTLSNLPSAPLAVTGHTANIIDSHMYIFLGYNPQLGYVNYVQKFNLANNSWSMVARRGSYVRGSIGHSSTFDPVDRLVYIYSGDHAQRSNDLYSFDPYTHKWTYLMQGSSSRYHHSSFILNRQLIFLGENSYNYLNFCFKNTTHMSYELTCSRKSDDLSNRQRNSAINNQICRSRCLTTIQDQQPDVLKRDGYSVVLYNNSLILFGGYNGLLLNDLRMMNITDCDAYKNEPDCLRTKLALKCYWNQEKSRCLDSRKEDDINLIGSRDNRVCTESDLQSMIIGCRGRATCGDCLSTNINCVWCSYSSQCHYERCSLPQANITEYNQCHTHELADQPADTSLTIIKQTSSNKNHENSVECKRLENCLMCHSMPYCSWQSDMCTYNPLYSLVKTPLVISSGVSIDGGADVRPEKDDLGIFDAFSGMRMSRLTQGIDSVSNGAGLINMGSGSRSSGINSTFISSLSSNHLDPSLQMLCRERPCHLRTLCDECIGPKCIWCSTSERCMDSSAYFVYNTMGQCMHYVAHASKCQVATCSDIQRCDECLTNPRCGWLNDISNTGKGKCMEGTSSGPHMLKENGWSSWSDLSPMIDGDTTGPSNITSLAGPSKVFPNWHYTSCPLCQCNGHSTCRANKTYCRDCQDYTTGENCDHCSLGYFGDPTNGGSCTPCKCNGHAQTCDIENGKCFCSTKGVIGHTCNKCDDQNHYVGDLSSSSPNGTCYYTINTDYQYTFNMSKSEDHFYSYINFINIPLRRDSDVDFTIACSRLAFVNITSGTSFKNRRSLHTNLECGSIRLRFPHDRHQSLDSNHSFFVHVYKFQTPFILQIAFSQHRTLYLPQFFFTFSSSFLFVFVLSGLVYKLKHEYDLYVRRQRQYIEMEQMASRPFSTVLLEIFKSPSLMKGSIDSKAANLDPRRAKMRQRANSPKTSSGSDQKMVDDRPPRTSHPFIRPPEPTPISFEPCFGSNIGVMSLFVQLPGKPNLSIGSALVSLNSDELSSSASEDLGKLQQAEKQQTIVKNTRT